MNKFFFIHIGETSKVYMDDMIVKFDEEGLHDQYITHVF